MRPIKSGDIVRLNVKTLDRKSGICIALTNACSPDDLVDLDFGDGHVRSCCRHELSFPRKAAISPEIDTRVGERLILGGILQGEIQFEEVSIVLKPEDFEIETHRRIWQCMDELCKRRENIDRVSIANELFRVNELESTGGVTYLISLCDGIRRPIGFLPIILRLRKSGRFRLSGAVMISHNPGRRSGACAVFKHQLCHLESCACPCHAPGFVPQQTKRAN